MPANSYANRTTRRKSWGRNAGFGAILILMSGLLFLVLAVTELITGGFVAAVVFALYGLVLAAFWRWGKLPFVVVVGNLPGIFLSAGGWAWGFYDRVPFFEPVTHFFATFGVALVLYFAVLSSVPSLLKPRWRGVSLVTALGMAAGGLWEIVEWAGFEVASVKFETADNVIHDLIADALGAVVAALLVCLTSLGRKAA